MEFQDLLARRRSVREFRPDPVPEAKLEAILEAANAAPSAGNLQAYEVVVVADAEGRAALAQAAHGQECLVQAPVALVFLANPARSAVRYGPRGSALYSVQDATIAAAFAHLRAADLGLGSVWVGAFDDPAVRRAVGAPEALMPVAILPVGVPAVVPEPTSRRGVRDVARRTRF